LQTCFAAARDVDHSGDEPPCGLARRVTDSVCGDSGSFRAPAAEVEPPAGVLGWSLADLTVAGGVVLAVSMLLFPALRDSRDASRRVDCENNLRNVYMAAANYAKDHGSYFPGIHPQDYAGMFVIRLVSEGYVAPDDMARVLVCKSSRLAELVQKGQVRIQLPRSVNENAVVGPTMAQLCGMASGSYAVRIGYVDADQYYWIREDRDERTPLMSDAPDFQMAGAQSANHGGHGQNVLYSDGHVEFLASSTLPSGDNLYRNVFGFPAAGRGRNDVVLVSGERTPGVEYRSQP
jgi:prepilin-type processing-associated H-X9-DG protein